MSKRTSHKRMDHKFIVDGRETFLSVEKESFERGQQHGKESERRTAERAIDRANGIQNRLDEATKTLRLLLTLEPGFAKYILEDEAIIEIDSMAGVYGDIPRYTTGTIWDIEGMERALEHQKNRDLAAKYVDSPKVVKK